MLVFEEKGQIVQIAGNYDDYLLYRDRQETSVREERRNARKEESSEKSAPISRKKGLSYQEKKRLDMMESLIAEAEGALERLQKEVNAPGFFERPFTETQSTLTLLSNAEQQVSDLFDEWMLLEAKKEEKDS